MKCIFCGSPEFSLNALKVLIKDPQIIIKSVITQPDKVRSRGRKVSPTLVKKLAQKNNLVVHTPEDKQSFSEIVYNIKPDLIVVVAYGMIIPKKIIDDYTCVNIHASLLPKYRGASPIQAALLHGETVSGLTLIKMNEKMDQGDIIDQVTCEISSYDSFRLLHDKLASLSSNILQNFLNNLKRSSKFTTRAQNHQLATYCKKISKPELELDGSHSILFNYNKIRAFSPVPGAYIIKNKQRIKILAASLVGNNLTPTMVKPEGKKSMSYSDYLLAGRDEIKLC